MELITAVSLLGSAATPTHQALCAYLGRTTGLPIELATEPSWQEQLNLLLAGAAQMAFLCGRVYTQHSDSLELLVAPVMAGERYQHRPIYFSDVIVPVQSSFQHVADLRGARWAYNEPNSFSGYVAVLDYLVALCEDMNYFQTWIETGSHVAALQQVAEGRVDGAAIDSIVLAAVLRGEPALRERIRTIASIGPSPVPPIVVRRDLPQALRTQLYEALIALHEDAEGRAILASATIERFVAVTDEFYNDLRAKATRARGIRD
jgi:phosphonate transport system substrate-binding protein